MPCSSHSDRIVSINIPITDQEVNSNSANGLMSSTLNSNYTTADQSSYRNVLLATAAVNIQSKNDPTFSESGKIDLLLGADIFSQIIQKGLRRGPKGSPIAQQTQFGWVLSGGLASKQSTVLSYDVVGQHTVKKN